MKFNTVKRRQIHEEIADQIDDQIVSGGLDEG